MSWLLNVRLLIEVMVTLVVILDPPGTLPIFLALTSTYTSRQRVHAALQAVLVSFGVIVAFALFGRQLLTYLHVSFPALQASGGLLLLLISLDLLTGKSEEPTASAAGANVAMVPLGTPLLAGPGAIVATMVFVQRADGATGWLAVALGIVTVHLVLYAFLRFANRFHRLLGVSGTTLAARIAGLLLAAIAVQMMADAVSAFIAAA